MSTYFISDLHLSAARVHTIELFEDFLNSTVERAEHLFILGDLFDAWIGDDYHEPVFDSLLTRLSAYTQTVPTSLIHGNRDFLLAQAFSQQTGIRLLPQFNVIDLYGTPTLIMHGDTLCTDDTEYQAMRAKVRHPDWIRQVLLLPVQQRLSMAKQFRMDSKISKDSKTEEIMDVNQGAVERCMQEYGVQQIIHGHTHRPNIHHFVLNGNSATRIVLGDWDETGSALIYSAEGYKLDKIRGLACK